MTNDDQINQLEADIIEQTRFAQEEPILEDSRYGQKKSAPVAPASPPPAPASTTAANAGPATSPGVNSGAASPPAGVPTSGAVVTPTSPASAPTAPLATLTSSAPNVGPSGSPSVPPGMTAIPTKLIKTAGIVMGILLLLLIGIAVMSRRQTPSKPSIQPTASPTSVSQTEMEQRVTDLQKRLEAADPTKQDLVFPPVDMLIRLDKKTN